MADELAGAGITARERLQNIEALLTKVDAKLDGKADAAALVALENRVREVETHIAEERAIKIERSAERARAEERLASLESGQDTIARKLAYATGTVSAVVVITNIVVAWIATHH